MAYITPMRNMPLDAVKEIMTWGYIQKSPHSFSFYNKKKDWGYTEEGTIRIANHWNFIYHGDSKLHAKTDIPVPINTWAKGIYNNGTFLIEKIYEDVGFSKEKASELRSEMKEMLDIIKVPFPQEIIEIRRNVSKKIKEGKVFCKTDAIKKDSYYLYLVKKMSNTVVEIEDGDILIKLPLSTPDISIIIDHVEHTISILKEKRII